MATPLIVADVPAEVGADWVAARLGETIMQRGEASLALSGGSSPQALYAALARRPVAWAHVDLFFVDERAVAADHPDSNFAMAHEALLRHIALRNLHRMQAERADREAAAREYAARLPEAIDVMLLGVGDDGHTASLFPGHDWSQPAGSRVLITRPTRPPPHERMTLAPEVIRGAVARLVYVTGAGKAEIVRQALEEPPDAARWPITAIGAATWLLDWPAAARLRRTTHG
jgi:6-phosphogluconolactonase